jgi:hypothetical protein
MPSRTPSSVCTVAAKTALPQPPNTSQNVPKVSAASRWSMVGAVISSLRCNRVRVERVT